jgi:hypothetical protein
MSNFNFEELAELYQNNPEEFEKKRMSMLEAFIESAPEDHQHSLRQTLFRIEMTRKTSKSPLQSALNASKLMWESYGKLRDVLEEAAEVVTESQQMKSQSTLRLLDASEKSNEEDANTMTPIQQAPKAKVIQFRKS